jgi:glycosyltransferase involved in cell wall biosynthesis
MKKGVLIISPSFHPDMGGIATHLDDLCRYLTRTGHKIFVATCQPIMTKKNAEYFEHSENVVILRAPLLGWRFFIPSGRLRFVYETLLLFTTGFFIFFFNARSIDVIHAHGHTAAFAAKLLKSVFSKRAILSTHNLLGFNPKKLSTRIIKKSLCSMDFIWTISQESKDELIRMGVSCEKIGIFTHWVNHDIFSHTGKQQSKARLGWADKFVVLFVGRLEPAKGTDILMNVASQSNGNMTFAFIGKGSMTEIIQNISTYSSNVYYIGEIENTKLPLYLSAADVLVVPTPANEGFGRNIIEALACGLPVIGTNIGRMPEIIEQDVGLIVTPPYDENIKTALYNLYNNPEKLAHFANNAAKYARQKYCDSHASSIVSSYEV